MSQSSPAPTQIRPVRWILFTLLTLGIVLAGLPATSASAAADGILKGTVTFHEATPTRTLEVYRETNGAWTKDAARTTSIASNGAYAAQVPAGEPVKLRVSFGSPNYGYFYGDAFHTDFAATAKAASGQTVTGVNLSVPEPVTYSGRLVDRSGKPVAGTVTPTVNTDGASLSIVDEPIQVDSSGEFQVFLPAKSGGVYEGGVMGTTASGDDWAWLRGGTGYEPDYYLNPAPGESYAGQTIKLPVGTATSSSGQQTTKLRALKSPVVSGPVRKGRKLHSTAGAYNKRPTTVRYQWLRNGKVIRGAKYASYKLKKADVRKHISVRVTAYSSGAQVRATSARTALVRAR